MSGRKRVMSEQLKTEIAKELGVYDTVKAGGGARFRKDCGNMVAKPLSWPGAGRTARRCPGWWV
jgi:small acid-soluble spore protein F (minor alpha/beta-type SASP)